jgi:hypothetical protein
MATTESSTLAAPATIPAPSLSPDDAAEALLTSLTAAPAPAEETPLEAKEEPAAQPEITPEEAAKTAAREERRRTSELYAKVQSQHAALDRRKSAIETKERELAATVEEIGKLTDITQLVAYVARKSGASEQSVWQDVADQIRNGGKRSPESELTTEVKQLRREREADKAEAKRLKDEQEAQEAAARDAEIASKWQESVAGLAKEDTSRWPSISEYPATVVGAAAMQIVNQVFERTGTVPTREDVLDYLEEQAAPKAAPAAPTTAKPKSGVAPKAKTVTNQDAASPVDPRTLNEQEREELAARQLEALMRAS